MLTLVRCYADCRCSQAFLVQRGWADSASLPRWDPGCLQVFRAGALQSSLGYESASLPGQPGSSSEHPRKAELRTPTFTSRYPSLVLEKGGAAGWPGCLGAAGGKSVCQDPCWAEPEWGLPKSHLQNGGAGSPAGVFPRLQEPVLAPGGGRHLACGLFSAPSHGVRRGLWGPVSVSGVE